MLIYLKNNSFTITTPPFQAIEWRTYKQAFSLQLQKTITQHTLKNQVYHEETHCVVARSVR